MKKAEITARGRRNKASTEIVAEASWEAKGDAPMALHAGLKVPGGAAPSAHVEGIVDVSYAVVLEADTGLGSPNPRVKFPLEVVCSLDSSPASSLAAAAGNAALGVPVEYSPDPTQKVTSAQHKEHHSCCSGRPACVALPSSPAGASHERRLPPPPHHLRHLAISAYDNRYDAISCQHQLCNNHHVSVAMSAPPYRLNISP